MPALNLRILTRRNHDKEPGVAAAFLRWTCARAVFHRGYVLTSGIYFVVNARLSASQIIGLGTVMAVTLTLTDIPAGAWSDAFSRKWPLVAGHGFLAAGMVLTGLVTAYPLILATTERVGRGEIDRWLPEELARLHNEFEQVHPFIDGNGRAGRLVINLVLVRLGYPPVIIFKRQRDAYLAAMRRADSGDYGALGELIARAMYDNLNRFIVPNVAGPARLVPLAALADQEFTMIALRRAAQRGRLDAVQGPDGIWRSSRRGRRCLPGSKASAATGEYCTLRISALRQYHLSKGKVSSSGGMLPGGCAPPER
jgi:Fic/DOC family